LRPEVKIAGYRQKVMLTATHASSRVRTRYERLGMVGRAEGM
jgi:predicted N-formylglutamate amidohydrolase